MEHSKREIHTVFNEISSTYDLTNQVLSFGLDKAWRKRLSNFIKPLGKISVLDMATGTGDQVYSLLKANPNIKAITGIDLAKDMIEIAKQKQQNHQLKPVVTFQEADALQLPFEDESFDIITMSFGIRNVIDTQKCFKEMLRVLKPSGKAYILEFSIPKNPFIKQLHLFYLRHVLPKVGGLISKKKSAYSYLNQTIESFPFGKDFSNQLEKAGFESANFYPQTFGITTIYEGIKCSNVQ